MKVLKRISLLLVAVCTLAIYIPFVVYAADGRISFTDPESTVGEMVEVRCVARSQNGNFGKMKICFTYDTKLLKFETGEGVTDEGDGRLIYKGLGSTSEATISLRFQAIEQGEGKVEIENASISSDDGDRLELEYGNASVKIAEGDVSKVKEDTAVEKKDKDDNQSDDESQTKSHDKLEKSKIVAGTILSKMQNILEDHILLFALLWIIIISVMLIVIIILGIKLRNRNDELDILYEEYGIDEEDEYEEDGFEKESYEEDFDEFEEDSYSVRGALDQDVFSAYDDRVTEDLSIDDLDDLLSERPAAKRSHMEEDDTFKVDFIDLD